MIQNETVASATADREWAFKSRLQLGILASITIVSFVLIFAAYRGAADDAIAQLHAQERILARQAATGTAEYFEYNEALLRFLGAMPEVRDMTEAGKGVLRSFFRANEGMVASVTRVDEEGTLVYTYPFETTARVSLAAQPHVARFLSTRSPVLSGVFTAVQGFAAIALYCPVFDGADFRGGIAILVPFEKVSKRHVESITVGRDGFAVLVDARGTILYSPVPGETGKPAAEAWSSAPDLAAAVSSARPGDEGDVAFAEHSPDGQRKTPNYASFVSGRIVDTAWTVVVRAPESEALGFILGFRDTWIALAGSLVVAFSLWTFFLARSAAKTRITNASLLSANAALESALADLKAAQDRLILSGKLAALGQLTASIAHQFNTPLGAIVSADEGVIHALRNDLPRALSAYAALPAELRETALSLWTAAAAAAAAPLDRRLKVDRGAKPGAEARLAAAGVEAPEEVAEWLADMGALGDAETASAARLASAPEGRAFLRAASSLSGALGSSTIIKHAAEKASATVTALRTYVRADRSEGWTTIDVGEEIDMMLALYVEGARNNLRIERRYAEGAVVRGVRDRLGQIWVNIIDNALYAMGDTGTLEIETRVEGGVVSVAIADSGPGIPPETAARIFEPFFTTKPAGEGSGIGLDIARGIAREHGGDLSFHSRPGRTVFTVSLPAAAPEGRPGA